MMTVTQGNGFDQTVAARVEARLAGAGKTGRLEATHGEGRT